MIDDGVVGEDHHVGVVAVLTFAGLKQIWCDTLFQQSMLRQLVDHDIDILTPLVLLILSQHRKVHRMGQRLKHLQRSMLPEFP